MIALDRTAAGVAREYAAAEVRELAPPALPDNLLVPRVFSGLVESMLRRSPTFARQCQRIAHASHLTVALEFAPARASHTPRARTHIVRRSGRLMATVVIAQPADAVELIAHEIEHIIEQLDDIDLALKAAVPHSGVHALNSDGPVFETLRAHRVGLRVADEVRRPPARRSSFMW